MIELAIFERDHGSPKKAMCRIVVAIDRWSFDESSGPFAGLRGYEIVMTNCVDEEFIHDA